MYESTFWADIISSLVWPITLFVILFLFRNQTKELIGRIIQIQYKELNFVFGDKVSVFSPIDNALHPIIEPTIKELPPSQKAEIPKLTPEEIEASKKRAQARLDEDTKKNGTQRGELFQLPDGRWAISWKAEATVRIGIR
jgi:hypothetical protein